MHLKENVYSFMEMYIVMTQKKFQPPDSVSTRTGLSFIEHPAGLPFESSESGPWNRLFTPYSI